MWGICHYRARGQLPPPLPALQRMGPILSYFAGEEMAEFRPTGKPDQLLLLSTAFALRGCGYLVTSSLASPKVWRSVPLSEKHPVPILLTLQGVSATRAQTVLS